MEERLKNYLAGMDELASKLVQEKDDIISEEEKENIRKDMLVQIQFFQHERLVHLIVTVTFAILTMLALLGSLLTDSLPLLLLEVLFLVLLIPYIRHYYILENGVQKLYQYYDKWNH